MSFRNILFPVDFSDRSRTVAPLIKAAVQRDHASLTLLSLVEIVTDWRAAVEIPVLPETNVDRLIEETEHSLTFFGGEHFAGIQPKILVEQGDPGTGIAARARSIGTDLIMMPTRGRGRFRAALLGSVTAKVLHDAHCPVWSAAHTDDLNPGPYQSGAQVGEWRNIVCAIDTNRNDTNPEGQRLIRYAAELAASYGSIVHLVHAVPLAAEAGPGMYFDRDFDVFLRDTARRTIDAMQKEAGTNFGVTVESGNVSSVTASAVRDQKADLVLAGRGTLLHVGGGLRTHLYAIIRDVPCAVLSV